MNELKEKIIQDIKASRKHLEYSYNKVLKFDLSKDLDEETLETLESFSSRFARFSDIAISKYFRVLAKEQDPAFSGTIIDLLNLMEKSSIIENAKIWRRIRELRNIAAHDYSTDDYKSLYQELIQLCPNLLDLKLP